MPESGELLVSGMILLDDAVTTRAIRLSPRRIVLRKCFWLGRFWGGPVISSDVLLVWARTPTILDLNPKTLPTGASWQWTLESDLVRWKWSLPSSLWAIFMTDTNKANCCCECDVQLRQVLKEVLPAFKWSRVGACQHELRENPRKPNILRHAR